MRSTKSHIYLIIFSLVAIVVLQGFYAYQDFKIKSVDFERDINQALTDAIAEADRIRVDSIQGLYARDIRDPNIFQIKRANSGDSISIYDWSGVKRTTIHFSEKLDSLSDEDIFDKIVEGNRVKVEKGVSVFWTDSIGRALTSYIHNIKISEQNIVIPFENRLKELSINTPYQFIFMPHDSAFTANIPNKGVMTNWKTIYTQDTQKAAVVFENPFRDILRSSWLVLSASIVVLLIIGISFLLLFRTINRQKQLAQLKDDFIDNITHELLTPISTLNVSLESLGKYNAIDDKDKARDYIDLSKKASDRVFGLIENVLRTSMYDKGKLDLKKDNFELKDVVGEVIAYHQMNHRKKVEFTFHHEEEIKLSLDKQHFSNVLHNLIENAIKYSSEVGTKVKISIIRQLDWLELVVADNGFGIPPRDQNKVFDKFHRVPQHDVHDISGMGIGLYYVKTILSRMGGEIALTKSSDTGSEFTIKLFQPTYEVAG